MVTVPGLQRDTGFVALELSSCCAPLGTSAECVRVPLIVCSFLAEVNGNLRGSLLLPDPLLFTFFTDRQTYTHTQTNIVPLKK